MMLHCSRGCNEVGDIVSGVFVNSGVDPDVTDGVGVLVMFRLMLL